MKFEDLSTEQQQFIRYAVEGHNILVDACIGSGKTMAIQTLCAMATKKRILYLTYNKLLKLDAKDRIRNSIVNVTNYHGFCYSELRRVGVNPGLSELIQTYNKVKPACVKYDVLILDEYQDIEQEIAEMLEHIKSCCPGIQIIAVGDMAQKIYDKTRLQVQEFITSFLDNYIPMEFTTCFRIGKEHAEMLGRIWNKKIIGANEDFKILTLYEHEAREIVAGLEPKQLLVLGSKAGKAQKFQNYLEKRYANVFNKHTLWSKIKDTEDATSPTPDCAIFTTYDGCKGMERDVCVLFDWSVSYWTVRLEKPDTKYEIMRNIFCVAASRAKKLLLIIKTDDPLTEEDLENPVATSMPYRDMAISEMFDYKFVEDVEAAYRSLSVTEIQPKGDEISVPVSDALIDLSPCIGHYQEAMYFDGYDIDTELEYHLAQADTSYLRKHYKNYSLDQKLLYLATLETKQYRYMNQVKSLPISQENRKRIENRLAERFTRDEQVQKPCHLDVEGEDVSFSINGIADVVKDNIVYEVKFVSALSHVHILQTAMYMACMGYLKGRLWNVRNNQMLEITIPSRQKFLDLVMTAVTKGNLSEYIGNEIWECENFRMRHEEVCNRFLVEARKKGKCSGKWIREWFEAESLQLPIKSHIFGQYLNRRGTES